MLERLLIAGSGGQGTVLTGRIIAAAAINRIPHITFLPAYGAEVRGGTSNCQVILSTDEISSPMPEQFDSMILLNQASVNKFLPKLKKNGLAIINTSLCPSPPSIPHIAVNATEKAVLAGNARVANLIALGVYIAQSNVLPALDVENEIKLVLSQKAKDMADMNIRAFQAGLSYRSPSSQ